MKLSYAAVLVAFTLAPRAFAQENVGGVPYALRTGMDLGSVPLVHPQPFDAERTADEDKQRAHAGKLPLYGRMLPLNADLTSSGLWSELPNGDHLWRLKINSPGALATELFFRDMYLPGGALLHVYDEAGGQVLGGFTSYNNKASGQFSTAQIDGETCVVEYYEPAAASGEGHFNIAFVGHAYRYAGAAKAQDCEVDVNCSPEGDGWADQRDGVVRVGVVENGQLGWCSGSLVNNVTLDCRPFFLTANHCGPNVTSTDLQDWKFYFRYQRSGCNTGSASTSKVMTGCAQRGESNDNGGDNGSDYLLLEADNPVPDSYTPFWLGWDATTSSHTGGKCIHHPNGDEKKISTYTGSAQPTTAWNGLNTHYRITWAETTNGHGVTEGGSSGSPLFDNAGHIIGTLTGGGSFCNSVVPGGENQPDFYGKMSYHWQSDPGPATDHLKNWLDPNNTGTMVLEGSYGPCGTLGIPAAHGQDTPAISPNPTVDQVSIVYPSGVDRADRIEVLDLTGRLVKNVLPLSLGRAQLDLSDLGQGTYLVRVVADGYHFAAVKVQVMAR